MSPPDLSGGICFGMESKELEDTFWYPGPMDPCRSPGSIPLKHWARAKEICFRCPIRQRCLETFLDERYGLYGGLDQYERYLLRRRRRRAAEKAAEEAREAVGWTKGDVGEAA